MLRLWREENSNRILLRLQSVEEDAHALNFSGLESFVAYLERITVEFNRNISPVGTLFVRQSIQNYEDWKQFFSAVSVLRQQENFTVIRVYRGCHNPDQVTTMLQFINLKTATTYAESDAIKAIVDRGTASQEIWFTTNVEHTAF